MDPELVGVGAGNHGDLSDRPTRLYQGPRPCTGNSHGRSRLPMLRPFAEQPTIQLHTSTKHAETSPPYNRRRFDPVTGWSPVSLRGPTVSHVHSKLTIGLRASGRGCVLG